MRVPPRVERPLASLAREVVAGPRYVLEHPLLRSVLTLEAIHSLFGINTAFITILASDVFRTGPEGLGLLLSAQAVGALASAGFLLWVGDIREKGRTMIAAGATYAIAFALLAIAATPAAAAVLIGVLGLTDGLWATMRNTVFQLTTDEAYRGRTMSLLLLAARGGTQGSQLESGIAVSIGGTPFAALLSAAVIGGSMLVVNARTPEVRGFRGLPDPLTAAAAAGPDADVS
jgi:hypothetical protein